MRKYDKYFWLANSMLTVVIWSSFIFVDTNNSWHRVLAAITIVCAGILAFIGIQNSYLSEEEYHLWCIWLIILIIARLLMRLFW